MRLLLNGEERDIAGISSIADLVAHLGLDARKVAVERNLEIAPRSTGMTGYLKRVAQRPTSTP